MAEIEESPQQIDGQGPSQATEVANVMAEVVSAVAEEEGGGIEDNIKTRPESARTPPRRRRKGWRLSLLLNAVTLGLGTWAVFKSWDIHIAKPSIQFLSGLAVGAWTGLNLVRGYKKSKRQLNRKRMMLNFEYGPKELKLLLGKTPYWLDFSATERLAFLNSLIQQMWRFYDSAICKQIIETVEPLMMEYKPIFVSGIKFRKLTFGDAPFKVTRISILREDVDELVLEMDIRWDGGATVAVGIDIIGTGFITPSVKRLDFFASVRVTLTRMVPKMPGFGAMLVSFRHPPLVTFDIDCGPGIGEIIQAWLIPFLKNDVLGNMLVWPNRIIIPLMPPEDLGPLDNLRLRTRGVLKVVVLEAKGLPKSDILGKGDPFAVIETIPFKPAKTKVIQNTDKPQWNETHYLKIQEKEQCLRVIVRDQESALVGAVTMQTSQFQGRALIPLYDFEVGETVDAWYPLGSDDWGALDGPGEGSGEIHLQLTYYSLKSLHEGTVFKGETTDSIPRGLVFVTVQEGHNLYSVDALGTSDPYCVCWLDGVKKTTRTLKSTRYPVWNESVDWTNVSAVDTLFVEIHDKGTISDRLLGKTQMALHPIVKEFTESEVHQAVQVDLELDGNRGEVILLVEWVPLDSNPLPISERLIRSCKELTQSAVRGVLFARLVSAEDLKNVDTIGLSDPYVILKIGGNAQVSKYINNNLNPVWNASFSWKEVKDSATLYGEVKDKGTVRDISLGVFKIRVQSLLDPPGGVRPFTVELRDKKTNDVVKGRVNLQLCWIIWKKEQEEEEPAEPKWPDFQDV